MGEKASIRQQNKSSGEKKKTRPGPRLTKGESSEIPQGKETVFSFIVCFRRVGKLQDIFAAGVDDTDTLKFPLPDKAGGVRLVNMTVY